VRGFTKKRNELNSLAQTVLPRGLANQYPNFPEVKAELKQDCGANESLEQIKSDPKVAQAAMDRIRSDATAARTVLEALGNKIVKTALKVDPSKELFREPATEERLAEGKGDKVQKYFNLGPLKGVGRCDEVIALLAFHLPLIMQ
jgi:septation ring formation regulator EzrA